MPQSKYESTTATGEEIVIAESYVQGADGRRIFVARDLNGKLLSPAVSIDDSPNSVRIRNSLSETDMMMLTKRLNRPILTDADLKEATALLVADESKLAAIQNATPAVATPPATPVQTPAQVVETAEVVELTAREKTKAICALMSSGCDTMPFGPICSMCSRFPNEQAYFDILNEGLNKLANAINFRKVFGDALQNLDFDLIKKLGMCALNISKSATAALNVAGMAYAAAGDPKAVEALCFVVLQRGGWMEPLDFVDNLISNMDATLENAELVAAICSNLSFDSNNLYKSLIAGLFYQCPVYDLRKISQMTLWGPTVGDYYMGEQRRKRALAMKASIFLDPIRNRLSGAEYTTNW
jgi:hypothetical protein